MHGSYQDVKLHLSILIETCVVKDTNYRVSRPEVIIKEIDGVKCEPFERCTKIPILHRKRGSHMGPILESLRSNRKGEMQDMQHNDNGQKFIIVFLVPARSY